MTTPEERQAGSSQPTNVPAADPARDTPTPDPARVARYRLAMYPGGLMRSTSHAADLNAAAVLAVADAELSILTLEWGGGDPRD